VPEPSIPVRVARHLDAFDSAVVDGDWTSFGERFTPDATMTFVGVPVGPWIGRPSIIAAYQAQPPTDTMTATGVDTDGDLDVVAFRWSRGGTGTMRLRWADGLVAELAVVFD
jgi:hypothetical protein